MNNNLMLLGNIAKIDKIAHQCEKLFDTDSNYNREKYKTVIEDKVRKLLKFDKPKIMVAGIYSAGKSTLINVFCRDHVAEVSAKPQTDKITPYPYNDFILVDSPGVDAPIKHEKITDEYVSQCHILLFVISTGMFESKKNYSKMYDWIKSGKPFIIVVNDKAGHKELDCPEIIELKNKIIQNLYAFSNDSRIGDKYDVIAVNAKRAEKGIFEDKPLLYKMSNLNELKEKIKNIMKKNNALSLVITPVNNLIELLDDFEKFQAKKVLADEDGDFDSKLYMFQNKRNVIIDDVKINIRNIIGSKENTLINGYVNNKDLSSSVMEDIKAEINQLYQTKISDIIMFAKSLFKGVDFHINDSISLSQNSISINVEAVSSDIFVNSGLSDKADIEIRESNGNITGTLVDGAAATAAAAVAKSILPIPMPVPPIILGPLIVAAGKVVDSIFKKNKEEEEKYKALLAQAEESNRAAQERANEMMRIRQDIRMQVESQCSRLENDFINNITANISSVSDEIVSKLVAVSKENEDKKQEISKLINESQKLKNMLISIKNDIV